MHSAAAPRPHTAARGFAALLAVTVTLGLVSALGALADHQYQQVWLAQQGVPAHTAAASAATVAAPRI